MEDDFTILDARIFTMNWLIDLDSASGMFVQLSSSELAEIRTLVSARMGGHGRAWVLPRSVGVVCSDCGCGAAAAT